MKDILAVLAALIVAFAGSEIVLRGMKLQTGLTRVVILWTILYAGLLAYLETRASTGFIAFTLFWSGAFLSWFGVRSHIESSILMRMLHLLRSRPMTAGELLKDYESHYGESMRLEELVRGNLILDIQRKQITRKGRMILYIVAMLR